MGTPINTYQDLIAWQKAFRLGLQVHRTAGSLPDSERFGLISMLRRGAVSIASDIAQGYGRGNTTEYIRFLKNARGTLYQIDTQLMFALELRYLAEETYTPMKGQLDECERVLAGLIKSLGG